MSRSPRPQHQLVTPPRSPQELHDGSRQPFPHKFAHASVSNRSGHRRGSIFSNELSVCLVDFVISLLPTPEEMAVKEDVRKLLERLIRTVQPQSRLLSFGSTANGFSLKNSDMDLCCLIDAELKASASDMVNLLGSLLERETKFCVKPLPHARIPIIKLTLDASDNLPFGIACDIGFENRLALENTRLLLSYATVDPTRVRTLVLFLKVWSKRRKINSPYSGTLSSYGYVLLVLYFLIHVKNPPVLPNLQTMPPLRPMSYADMHLNGHNIWFFDDIEVLRTRWKSPNADNVADLLVDFFRYFSRDFPFVNGVASIRAGLLQKEQKGWLNESDTVIARDCNRLCIEDPFETTYNVGRTVTKDGLFLIRGEFIRAAKILNARHDSPIAALAQLCQERTETYYMPSSTPLFQPPAQFSHTSATPSTPPSPSLFSIRPSGAIPIRAPSSLPSASKVPTLAEPTRDLQRPRDDFVVVPKELHADASVSVPTLQFRRGSQDILADPQSFPEHMAPTRSPWTSPPPADASPEARTAYEAHLGLGLTIATAPSDARERERPRSLSASSLGNTGSDHSSDEELLNLTGDMKALNVLSPVESNDGMRSLQLPLAAAGQINRRQDDGITPASLPYFQQRSANQQTDALYDPPQPLSRMARECSPREQPALRITGLPATMKYARHDAIPIRGQHHLHPRHSSNAGVIDGRSIPSAKPSWQETSRRSFSGIARPRANANYAQTFPLPLPVPYGSTSPPGDPFSRSVQHSATEISPSAFAFNLALYAHRQNAQQLTAAPGLGSVPDNGAKSFQTPRVQQAFPNTRFTSGEASPSSPRNIPLPGFSPYNGPMLSSPTKSGLSPTQRSNLLNSARPQLFPLYKIQPQSGSRLSSSGSASGQSPSSSEASPSPLRTSLDLPTVSATRPSVVPQSGLSSTCTPLTLPIRSSNSTPRRKKTVEARPKTSDSNLPPLLDIKLPIEPPLAHILPPAANSRRKGHTKRHGASKTRRQSQSFPLSAKAGSTEEKSTASWRPSDLDTTTPRVSSYSSQGPAALPLEVVER